MPKKGIGIEALPNYRVAFGDKVAPLQLPATAFRDIWLTYRRETRQSQPVATVIDWLNSIFHGHKWP